MLPDCRITAELEQLREHNSKSYHDVVDAWWPFKNAQPSTTAAPAAAAAAGGEREGAAEPGAGAEAPSEGKADADQPVPTVSKTPRGRSRAAQKDEKTESEPPSRRFTRSASRSKLPKEKEKEREKKEGETQTQREGSPGGSASASASASTTAAKPRERSPAPAAASTAPAASASGLVRSSSVLERLPSIRLSGPGSMADRSPWMRFAVRLLVWVLLRVVLRLALLLAFALAQFYLLCEYVNPCFVTVLYCSCFLLIACCRVMLECLLKGLSSVFFIAMVMLIVLRNQHGYLDYVGHVVYSIWDESLMLAVAICVVNFVRGAPVKTAERLPHHHGHMRTVKEGGGERERESEEAGWGLFNF